MADPNPVQFVLTASPRRESEVPMEANITIDGVSLKDYLADHEARIVALEP